MGDQGAPAPPAHVLLVSFPGQGHVNPILRLAKRVASMGLFVTFSSSSDIVSKISASTGVAVSSAVPIGTGHLLFEPFSDRWDADDPRRNDLHSLMSHMRDSWPAALADLIRRQADHGRPVSCFVNNPFLPWLLDVATDMGIPSAVLWVQSAAVFSTYYYYHRGLAEFPTTDRPDVSVAIPGLPIMKPNEIPTFLLPSNPFKSLTEAILAQFGNLHKASWVLANTFDELERDAIKAISGLLPVIPVGPLVDIDYSGINGDLWKPAACMEWLDEQQPRSVVYVSVGSVVVLSKDEMAEMAHGLRDSGLPFLWVVRDGCRELLPQGFVEGTTGSEMVVDWSPQERVLAHEAVGCFLTHCGWNSTLEALAAGVPVVAYPQWGDQVPDAKFMVEVCGMGMWLRAPLSREKVAGCVETVTTGIGAAEMRRRAVAWKEAARAAVADGGSSDRNIEAFVDEVRRRVCSCLVDHVDDADKANSLQVKRLSIQ